MPKLQLFAPAHLLHWTRKSDGIGMSFDKTDARFEKLIFNNDILVLAVFY